MKNKMKVHCNDCDIDFEISPIHHLKYNNGGCPECHKHRIVKCSCCGKEIIADYHVHGNIKIFCEECRSKKRNSKHDKFKQERVSKKEDYIKTEKCTKKKLKQTFELKRICKICGRELNDNGNCDNDFCKDKKIANFNSVIKYFGFNKNKLGTIEVEDEFNRIRTILYDMYWIRHMSST